MTTRNGTHHKRKQIYPRQSVQERAALAQCKDLTAQIDTALGLLHDKGKRIVGLQQRLERAVEANQALETDMRAANELIAEQHMRIEAMQTDSDRTTQQVVAATLRKVDSYEQGTQRLRDVAFEGARL